MLTEQASILYCPAFLLLCRYGSDKLAISVRIDCHQPVVYFQPASSVFSHNKAANSSFSRLFSTQVNKLNQLMQVLRFGIGSYGSIFLESAEASALSTAQDYLS
jgi:hypothetical protein